MRDDRGVRKVCFQVCLFSLFHHPTLHEILKALGRGINIIGPMVNPTKNLAPSRKKNPGMKCLKCYVQDVLISVLSVHWTSLVVMLLHNEQTSLGITLEDTSDTWETVGTSAFGMVV